MTQSSPVEKPASSQDFTQPLTISFVEFLALAALLMALTAMSIDIMLPALPAIGSALGVGNENDRQLVVVLYMAGFAVGQLFYGPLSDRIGRRPAMLGGLAIYVLGTLLAAFTSSFSGLLVARVIQGIGSAGPRVVTVSVIRDVCSGRQMGRVMSLTMMVFLVVPMVAPTIGQTVTLLGSWRSPFYVLLAAGLAATLWAASRLPETGRTSQGQEAPPKLVGSFKATIFNRQTMAYGIASGFMTGPMLTYIASAQQIFVEIYGLGLVFPVVFGGVALGSAAASFLNARIVGRLGLRRVSHTALVCFCVVAVLMLVLALCHAAVFLLFLFLVASTFFLFMLIVPNFTALAMEPQGRNAGMASSVIGALSTAMAAAIGGSVARAFNGTVVPLSLGFVGCGVAALAVVYAVEGQAGLFGRKR